MATSIEGCLSFLTNPESVGNEHLAKNIRSLRPADFHRAGILDPSLLVSIVMGVGSHRPTLPHGYVAQETPQTQHRTHRPHIHSQLRWQAVFDPGKSFKESGDKRQTTHERE